LSRRYCIQHFKDEVLLINNACLDKANPQLAHLLGAKIDQLSVTVKDGSDSIFNGTEVHVTHLPMF